MEDKVNTIGRRTPRPFTRNVLYGVGVFLIFIFLAEMVCRLLVPEFSEMQHGRFRRDYQIDPLLTAGVFLLDEHAFWRLAPSHEYGINAQGFRDPKETSIDKPPARYRIICIGDSVTFGVPEELNKSNEVFPKRLEALLHINFPDREIEVLNAGTPGYSSYQGLAQLKYHLVKYQPDLVIVQFGTNDFSDAVGYPDKEQHPPSSIKATLKNSLGKSALVYTFVRLIISSRQHGLTKTQNIERVSVKDFQDNLSHMRTLAKQDGFKLIFITPVRFESGKMIKLEKAKPPTDVIIADMFSAFTQYEFDLKRLFYDEVHLTREGHRVLARKLYETILAHQLIHEHFGEQL